MVRRLGIFELDAIRPPDTRPFVYSEKIGGNEITRPFDVAAWEKPPAMPTPEQMAAQPGTVPYYFYFEWSLYWAATYKAIENKADVKRYCKDVADYIMTTCISSDDKARILSLSARRLRSSSLRFVSVSARLPPVSRWIDMATIVARQSDVDGVSARSASSRWRARRHR